MKTLRLSEGDLTLRGRAFAETSGTGKVQQDLRGALAEPIGNDRFHPGWGSTLERFVAAFATEDTDFEVRAEVNRVISNYAAVQRDKIEADIYSDGDTRFSTNEVLSAISGVTTTVRGDRISVDIQLRTASGETVALNEDLV
jgi:phage baseplate assembly protein W